MTTQKKWTDFELSTLEEDYLSRIDKSQLESKYKRNWENIRVKANSLGYRRGMPLNTKKYKLPLSKLEIQKLYTDGQSSTKIAEICGCSNVNILSLLKREKVPIRGMDTCNVTYTINSEFFDVIDSSEKAYILGILYADGYNDGVGAAHITLQEGDKQILEDINVQLGSNKPLRYTPKSIGQNSYSLNIENKRLSEKLTELGCMRAKSLILQYPTEMQLPKIYRHHFIRGYFDGDGCVFGKQKGNCGVSFEGNADFIKVVQQILIEECGFRKTKLYQKHKERKSSVSLKYTGKNQLKRIFEYLYKDSTICLIRKHTKFISIL